MIVHQEKTVTGKYVFTPFECPFCKTDTLGNHENNCPNKKKFIPDPVEDYSDQTEFY